MKSLFSAMILLAICVGMPGASFSASSDFTEFHDPFESAPTPALADPFELLNRASFWLNDQLYTKVLAPLSETIADDAGRKGESFLSPIQVGGAELRFRLRDAGSEMGRFVLHGMVSLLTRLEPEKTAELAAGENDLGATMEAFGIGPGYYLVLPILGPSSVRDGIGRLSAFYLDPAPHLFAVEKSSPASADEESFLDDLETYLAIRRDSLDPYLFIRDAYSQQLQEKEYLPSRHARVAKGFAG